jgi:DNA (cytosine-5)-methyltransferase 3A
MKVLSLFDGISCGRVALERAGIPVETYYASEIDKYAMSVAQAMYPDTIQIGDVCKVDFTQYIGKVDMIIGGSPCQDLSIAKQNRQGLQGERSRLFWEYIKALTIIKPKYFLLENVASMKNEDRDAITAVLRGIYPETKCIMINSALVSAQQRKRYYWTNWHVEQPEDKGIVLKDILENSCSHQDKAHCLDANYYKGASLEHTLTKHKRTQVFEPVGAAMRTREDENGKFKRLEVNGQEKSNALTSVQTDSMVCESIELVPFVENKLRDIENKYGELPQMFNPYNKQKITDKAPTQTCQCASQTKSSTVIMFQPVRIGQLDGLGKGQANRIYSVRGKSVCLNANGGGGGAKTGLYKIDLPDGDYIVRKLTPRECARLQTYPERCFDVANISNTQWYKAFGNGWTVDVIAHIFKQIPTE